MNIEQFKKEVKVEFEKELKNVEDIYYGEGDGWDNLSEYLESDKNILCQTFLYPESYFELDPDKVIKWFNSKLDQAIKLREEKLIEEIENLIINLQAGNNRHEYWGNGYIKAKQDIINLIKSK